MKKGINILLGFIITCFLSCSEDKNSDEPNSDNIENTEYEMKEYWMVFLKKGPNRNQDSISSQKIQTAHLENIDRLAKLGKILVAGPFGDDGNLKGIFIMNCKDSLEVKQLVESDTAIITGRLTYEIKSWWTAKGGSFK